MTKDEFIQQVMVCTHPTDFKDYSESIQKLDPMYYRAFIEGLMVGAEVGPLLRAFNSNLEDLI